MLGTVLNGRNLEVRGWKGEEEKRREEEERGERGRVKKSG